MCCMQRAVSLLTPFQFAELWTVKDLVNKKVPIASGSATAYCVLFLLLSWGSGRGVGEEVFAGFKLRSQVFALSYFWNIRSEVFLLKTVKQIWKHFQFPPLPPCFRKDCIKLWIACTECDFMVILGKCWLKIFSRGWRF